MSDQVGGRSGRSQAATPEFGPELSVWSLGTIVLRHRRLFFTVTSVVTVLGVALVFLLGSKRSYTTTVSLSLQASDARMSGLAGVAAQYGFSLPGRENPNSPQFYADLLRSRRVLAPVARATYTVRTDSGPARMTLVDWHAEDVSDEGKALENTLKALNTRIETAVDRETGVVRFAVRAAQPELARQIAEQMLAGVHDYNLSTRRSNAAAEREFIEDRLSEMRAELRQSEEQMEGFLRQNRQFENSPDLRFAYDRLNRELVFKQQIVTSLTQSYEQARIDEVRNTPVFTLVEEPITPVVPDPRGRVIRSIIVLILAIIIGLAAAIGAGVLANARATGSGAYHDFSALLKDVRRDLAQVFQRAG